MTQPDPAHNPVLIGHEEARRQVAEAFASGRMHHAWLIAGIEGIGKTKFASHVAHHVLSNGQIPLDKINAAHPAAKLIAAGAHPDMLVVRREIDEKTGELRASIVADDARKIAPFFHRTAVHGGWRVVIVDEAQTLNRASQNTILKILEEPPPRALILMTVTTPGALLPTIRSRCRLLPLEPLDEAHMKAVLARETELSGDELARVIDLSGGSAGFALRIIRTETMPLYEDLLELLGAAPDLDIARLHKLADQIGRKADAESFAVVTTLLVEHLRLAARAQAGEGGTGTLDRALYLWDRTRATFAMADTGNLDRKLAFINAVSDISRAAA